MRMAFVFKSAAILAAIASALPAFPADIPKEGRYDYTSCFSGSNNIIEFSKTHTATSSEFTGTNRSNPPGGLYDRTTFRCVAMSYSFEGKGAGTTVCEVVDKDGDKLLTRFVVEGSKLDRLVMAGTGKYEGIVSSGVAESLGPFPVVKPGTFQNCSRQTGTYKLK